MFRLLTSVIKTNRKFCSTLTTPQIVQEIVKNIDSRSVLNIVTPFHIKISPYDLLDCQDANILRARLITSKASTHNEYKLNIKMLDNVVDISTNDEIDDDAITCHLEIPVSANLNIKTKRNVQISELYNDIISVETAQNINTKNLRSSDINFKSTNGDISCNGTTLSREFNVVADNRGNIFLDKLQGDFISCKTDIGNITVNSCYVENSKFATNKGNLDLQNVHKRTEVLVLTKGMCKMTGIHGNIYLRSYSGDLDLQFSEIVDENIIIAEDSKNVTVNISDAIEHDSFIEIHANNIKLDSSLSHLSDCLLNNSNTNFVSGRESDFKNKLMISTRGTLQFGKMSWADSIKKKFA